MKLRPIITRTVWVVSLVSLFTDVASEMLYPIMPVYLKSIGFSIVLIGILEGVAEATAGLSKGYFGLYSDRIGSRLPFIRWGYTLSALSKPLMALLTSPWWIFFARTTDRLGKGVRTSARDALLSDETNAENKAGVFGFHRALDTVGAAIGPVLALIYLWFYPGNYKTLFLIAFIPGLIAIGLTFLLKEKKNKAAPSISGQGVFSYLQYWKKSRLNYRYLVIGLLLFSLFNSSDVFLLLQLKKQLGSDTQMIGFYIFYNLVYALFSFPLGILADRIGKKRVLMAGLILFAVVYFLFGLATTFLHFAMLFLLYGIYAAATEGVSKALITEQSAKQDTATALGFYNSFASLMTFAASSLAGWIWYSFSATAMFTVSAIGVLMTTIYFIVYQLNTGLMTRSVKNNLPK